MQIDITYDASVNNAPAAFKTGVEAAVQYLENEFTKQVTINIDVGYGEIDGQTIEPGALSESLWSQAVSESYTSVRSALLAQNAPGASTLPAASPDQGTLAMCTAEAKALGLLTNSGSIDGYVGFSSSEPFYFGTGTPPAGEYDFVSAAEHEMTEDMGRVSLIDNQPYFYSPMDLYRYSAPGALDLTTGKFGSTAYFSINDGATNLATWNNDPGNGDLGDWYGNNVPNNGNDSFNDYSYPGVVNAVSQSDITLMNALGWTSTAAAPASPPTPPSPPASGGNDANNNGVDTDLLWRNSAGGVTEWVLDGASLSSSQAVTYQGNAVTVDSSWSNISTGDLNADDGTESLWRQSSTGLLAEWTMSGSQITSSRTLTFQGQAVTPDSSWSVAALGNFENGGDTDILWRQAGTGALAAWTMSNATVAHAGTVTFEGQAVTPDSSWSVAGVGDFNGSGNSEILWQQSSTGLLSEWILNGSQIVGNAAVTQYGNDVTPNSSWSVAGIGDFSGNGKDDILWRQSGSDTLAMWLMDGSTISSSATVTYQGQAVTPDSSWQIVDIGDFNGGNDAGILWQQSTTGALVEWQMNGAQITSSDTLMSQGSPALLTSGWQAQAKPNQGLSSAFGD